jgi:hypothetical protein
MLKRLALAVAIVAMLHAAFVWGYMPVRARRLSAKYAAFRAGYVDDGVRDGPVILFMHRPPEAWYSWRYVLPLVLGHSQSTRDPPSIRMPQVRCNKMPNKNGFSVRVASSERRDAPRPNEPPFYLRPSASICGPYGFLEPSNTRQPNPALQIRPNAPRKLPSTK